MDISLYFLKINIEIFFSLIRKLKYQKMFSTRCITIDIQQVLDRIFSIPGHVSYISMIVSI